MCVCVCVCVCVCDEDVTLHCTTVAYVSIPHTLSRLTPDKSKFAALHAIMACRRVRVQLSPFLSSALDRVQWAHITSPQLYTRKYPRYALNLRLCGLKSGSGRFEEETNLLLIPGLEIRISQPVVQSLHKLRYLTSLSFKYVT